MKANHYITDTLHTYEGKFPPLVTVVAGCTVIVANACAERALCRDQ